ncbi:MAG: hypothetical protein JNM93_13535 [Bacteriovoracaceae bacterium]|nr:hypothetical protein [Bacteriovoracaceae bacterium]
MRLMTDFENVAPKSSKKTGGQVREKVSQPMPSAEEIRQKVQANKAKAIAKEKAMVDPVEISPGVRKIQEADGVLMNDPTQPETVGKVKDALSMSFVQFSDKERSVLQNILNQNRESQEA